MNEIDYHWFKAMINSSSDAIMGINLENKIIKCNNGVTKIYGYTPAELIGKDTFMLIPENDQAEVAGYINRAKKGESIPYYEAVRIRKDKSIVYVSVSLSTLKVNDKIIGFVVIVRDISHLKETEKKLVEKSQEIKLIKTIFDNATEGMIIANHLGIIKAANPAIKLITGYSAEELIGQPTGVFKSGKYDSYFYKNLWDSLDNKSNWSGELWHKNKDKSINLSWVSINVVKNDVTKEFMYVGVLTDLSERLKYEKELKKHALYDLLTGLPNRYLLDKKFNEILAVANESKKLIATCFLDLDKFKNVNDNFGHDTGDILLQMVSKRLSNSISRVDFLARLSGDEFIILIFDFKEEKNLINILERIITNVDKPYQIKNNVLSIKASIGVSVYPFNGSSMKELLKQADIAMYKAKKSIEKKYFILPQ